MAGYLYVLPIQLQIHSKISAMNMKRCLSACILLMLSLEGALLVVGRPSQAAAAATTIRLPSDTQAAASTRPWDCCDFAQCTKSIPPYCRCRDEVDHCAATCKDCAASPTDPSRHVCQDMYMGNPGPMCTDEANNVGN
ncbi:Bowman-Birk type bran trypsin inhibitor-like [Lolium rigidum]|uniref:Bowman-Birk type bran trypsin inhibitor-like n=1 Tax=Lolium rigidum TaxID=89674 RepID=UPI001F5DEC79|nr:Bowman-Birk type bran trypsin inhibitor-like [Lolium rigidum]